MRLLSRGGVILYRRRGGLARRVEEGCRHHPRADEVTNGLDGHFELNWCADVGMRGIESGERDLPLERWRPCRRGGTADLPAVAAHGDRHARRRGRRNGSEPNSLVQRFDIGPIDFKTDNAPADAALALGAYRRPPDEGSFFQ